MQYRKIGNSDLEVSVICLGTWVFGGDCWGEADDARSVRVVEEALDNGVNFIDTAPIYGSGRSESVIQKGLKNKKDVIIATKCGLEIVGKGLKPNLTSAFIREEIENSLRRLSIERIDLYQCHWPDPNTPIQETCEELNKLVSEGKIRYIGVSNFTSELMSEMLDIVPVVSNQVQYSLLQREIEEDILPLCSEKGLSVLPYGALGGGILTGKYAAPPQMSKGDVRSFFYKFYKEPFWSKAQTLLNVLREIASEHDVPVSQVAINWILRKKEIASCLVGCRTPEQLMTNIGAGEWSLNAEEIERIGSVKLD